LIKSDERELFNILSKSNGRANCLYDHIKTKRHVRILEKWARKGFWEYGVSVHTGWVNTDHPSYLAISCAVKQGLENALV
jgi:hypothetical protein